MALCEWHRSSSCISRRTPQLFLKHSEERPTLLVAPGSRMQQSKLRFCQHLSSQVLNISVSLSDQVGRFNNQSSNLGSLQSLSAARSSSAWSLTRSNIWTPLHVCKIPDLLCRRTKFLPCAIPKPNFLSSFRWSQPLRSLTFKLNADESNARQTPTYYPTERNRIWCRTLPPSMVFKKCTSSFLLGSPLLLQYLTQLEAVQNCEQVKCSQRQWSNARA